MQDKWKGPSPNKRQKEHFLSRGVERPQKRGRESPLREKNTEPANSLEYEGERPPLCLEKKVSEENVGGVVSDS